MGATPAELENAVLAAYQQGVEKSVAEVRELSDRLGIAELTISVFFTELHEAQVPLGQVPAKFQEFARHYLQLKQQYAVERAERLQAMWRLTSTS